MSTTKQPTLEYLLAFKQAGGALIIGRDKNKSSTSDAAKEVPSIIQKLQELKFTEDTREQIRISPARIWHAIGSKTGAIFACCTIGFDVPRLPYACLEVNIL